ncbi:MAG: type I-U CRISPR-associated protein Csb2 [bacterium]
MIAIRCTLLRDVFEGGRHDDPRRPEWPPSWMRLFSALVSVAEADTEDDEVLRALEASPPPAILASQHRPQHRRAFVPTNMLLDKGTHTVLAARTNSERGWARAVPRSREIWYRWPSLDLPLGGRDALAKLCRRVPYLGRSTSPAIVELRDDPPDEGDWLLPDESGGQSLRLSQPVRSPFPGSLTALRDAYEEKHVRRGAGAVWQIGVGVDYGRPEPEDEGEAVTSGPYRRMIVFRYAGHVVGDDRRERRRIDGRHTARLSHAMRRALMSRAEEHIPSLHGHHDGTAVQCALVGLPHVGHEHASGHLVGMALCVPDLPPDELWVLANALPAVGDELPVVAGPLGELAFERLGPLDGTVSAWALRPDRWQEPAKRWATVLPLVLDRFLKRSSSVEDEVRRAVRNSRLPDPVEVQVSHRGRIHGALALRPADTLRRPEDRAVKPYRHAEIEFAEPVRGPVVVGSMRHYGLGLCVPREVRHDG